jgi:multicomponent Na+:H+ antiporter subunit E
VVRDGQGASARGRPGRAALGRGMVLLGFWIVLIGTGPADLAAGVVTAAAATWASLRLAPPGWMRVRVAALPAFALRFLWQSVAAGVDVARRAFDPRLPLRPGFVRYPARRPGGAARAAFASYSSLLPGTVPVEDDGEVLLYHCLDIVQPVAAQLAVEEAAFARVFGSGAAKEGPR